MFKDIALVEVTDSEHAYRVRTGIPSEQREFDDLGAAEKYMQNLVRERRTS